MLRHFDEALGWLAMVTLVLLLVGGPIGAVVAGLLLPFLLVPLVIVLTVWALIGSLFDLVSRWLDDS